MNPETSVLYWTCPKCGSQQQHLSLYSNGRHRCSICGYDESTNVNGLENGGQTATPYTPPNTPQSNPYDHSFGMTGWICPKCGRGVSPFTDVCPCQGYFNTITYSSNLTESK
jgi:rubredoxin